MNNKDLTVIYLTANRLSNKWLLYQQTVLCNAISDAEIISISRERMIFGKNLIDEDEPGYINIYRQMLRASKLATTEYVAMAEDDVLYSKDHFRNRPETISYNMHRWALFSWGYPMYSMRDRVSNCSMIAKREYLIEALEERFAKYPGNSMPLEFCGEVGRERIEKNLGVSPRKMNLTYSETGIIQINHTKATEDRQKRMRKTYGKVKAYDIPYWGRAEDVIQNFRNLNV